MGEAGGQSDKQGGGGEEKEMEGDRGGAAEWGRGGSRPPRPVSQRLPAHPIVQRGKREEATCQ